MAQDVFKRFIKWLCPFIMMRDELANIIGKQQIEQDNKLIEVDDKVNAFKIMFENAERLYILKLEYYSEQRIKTAKERGMIYALAYRVKCLLEKTVYNLSVEQNYVMGAIKKDVPEISDVELESVIKTIYNEA